MGRVRRAISAYGYLVCHEEKGCGELKHITEFYRNDGKMWRECRELPLTSEELVKMREEGKAYLVVEMDNSIIPQEELMWFGQPQSVCKDCYKNKYRKERHDQVREERVQQMAWDKLDSSRAEQLFRNAGEEIAHQDIANKLRDLERERERMLATCPEHERMLIERYSQEEWLERADGFQLSLRTENRRWLLFYRKYDGLEPHDSILW